MVSGGWAVVSPAGRSAVTASSSAYAPSTWLTRRSNSSLASRPCTNAALSASSTCSLPACDVGRLLSPSAPAAILSPGSATAPTLHACNQRKRSVLGLGQASSGLPGHGQLRFVADVRGEPAGPAPVIDT